MLFFRVLNRTARTFEEAGECGRVSTEAYAPGSAEGQRWKRDLLLADQAAAPAHEQETYKRLAWQADVLYALMAGPSYLGPVR